MSVPAWIAIALLGAATVAVVVGVTDIRCAYRRIAGSSSVITSAQGDIEFKRGGSGPPVLVIHGSGGGFDQGELIAQTVLGDSFDWIAPSRFGYLRSTFREHASFEDQAHAYTHLLDTQGVDKVAVLALSHGGPSALFFAVLYPGRVSSLTLLSCGVAASSDGDQAQANRKGDALTKIFKYDLLYWMVSKFFRRQLMALMGANETVIVRLTREQRDLVDRVIECMNPVAPRAAGVVFDHGAEMPNGGIAAIRAPTLVIHARDDTLQLYRNAEFAIKTIPGARLVSFDRGGHLLMAIEQPAIQAEVQKFIRSNLDK